MPAVFWSEMKRKASSGGLGVSVFGLARRALEFGNLSSKLSPCRFRSVQPSRRAGDIFSRSRHFVPGYYRAVAPGQNIFDLPRLSLNQRLWAKRAAQRSAFDGAVSNASRFTSCYRRPGSSFAATETVSFASRNKQYAVDGAVSAGHQGTQIGFFVLLSQ
jgi:hypothetical protein